MAERAFPFNAATVASQIVESKVKAPRWGSSINARSTSGRLVRGVAWNLVGNAVAQGGTFASSIILARVLGKHSYGQLALIQSTVMALTSLSSLGLGMTATKYVSEFRSTDSGRVGRILGLSSMVALVAALCFSIGLALLAPSLVAGGGETGELVSSLRLGAIFVFFVTLNGYQIGALVGLEDFRSIARISVISGVVSLTLCWALSVRMGLYGAILAQSISSVLVWLLYQVALTSQCRRFHIRIRYRGAWALRSILIGFSVPGTMAGSVASLAVWCCNAELVRSCGYAELALFAVLSNLRSMVIFLPALIARVVSPHLNHLLATGKVAGYRRMFWGSVAVNGGIALGLAVVLSIAGQRLLGLFGKDFTGSSWLILIFLLSVTVEVIANNLYQTLFATGNLWRNFWIIAIWAVVLVCAARFSAARWGISGLVYSYLVAWCIAAVLYAAVAREQAGNPVCTGRN